jgi:hypothetical protein
MWWYLTGRFKWRHGVEQVLEAGCAVNAIPVSMLFPVLAGRSHRACQIGASKQLCHHPAGAGSLFVVAGAG